MNLSRARAPAVAPGVTLHGDGAAFAVRSRHAERIFVCLFDADGAREIARWRLGDRYGDLHCGFIPGVGAGARYGLRADGPYEPRAGHRFDPAKLLVDPYATRIDRPFVDAPELCAPRTAEIDTAALVPKAILEVLDARPQQPVRAPKFIYEVAIKAYTQLDPDLPLELRGRLAGLGAPHVVERLARLGVSHVELMPVAAWIDEGHLQPHGLANAWGYNPVVFMAPDPRLAPNGIADLRKVVDALRAAGIGTILDVVFNHTGESDEAGPTLSLRGLDNALYYRRAQNGALINDTGCGNTLACDDPAFMQLTLDSLRHFVDRAGVDGFRFDLATVLGRSAKGFSADAPLLTAIAQDPVLRDRLLIAEPWDVGPGGYQLGAFRYPWAEWNDHFRDDVRRFWRGDSGKIGALATRIAGSADRFQASVRRPSASVNFVAAHDGFALRDVVSFEHKRNHANGEDNRDGSSYECSWNCGVEGETSEPHVREARMRAVRALLATLFLSRGAPMLTAGDEFGRTQGGNNNAYAQDNATTWLDWAGADTELAGFVAGLAQLRASLPALGEDLFLTGLPGQGGDHPDVDWRRPDGLPMGEADWADGDCLALTLTPIESAGGRVHLVFNRGPARPLVLPAAAPARAWRLALDSAAGRTSRESGALPATLEASAQSVLAFAEVEA